MTASRTIVRVLGGKLSLSIARARLALELRSVAYELMDEPLEPRKSDRLLTANPAYGKIPVLLLLDGFAICESVVIVQYVEDVAQAGGGAGGEGEAAALLLPEDPYERAMHRFWTAYIDDRLWLAIDAVSLGPTSETHVQATGDARAALRLLEGAFTDCSSGVGFFSGSDVGLRAPPRALPIDASTTPLMDRWSHRFAAHPAARRGLPDTNKVVEFTRFFQAKFKVDVSK
uniref:Glutathione S-transferase n=1 Tax=Setaria italica TaxID=4555 RepID=K3YKX6_SETIT